MHFTRGIERWMRPCGARAHRHRPYPSSSYFATQPHTNKIRPCVIHPKRNKPSMYNPSLPISTKPRGVSLPHRGYTFDSAGFSNATQPTLGNDVRDKATPLGVVLFSSCIITTRGEQMVSRTQIDFKKYNADGIGSSPRLYPG